MIHKTNSSRRKRRGFTLIELLVVILIISILMAIAAPLYLSSYADTQVKTCRANMQTIANAVQAARVSAIGVDYSAVIAGGVTTSNLPNLDKIPVCPNGGTYTLTNGSSGNGYTFRVLCNGASAGVAHGTFEPGIDGN